MKRVIVKWFCRGCWRHGEMELWPNDASAIVKARREHAIEVNMDRQAGRVPAGMVHMQFNAIKIKSIACKGDVQIGTKTKRSRFKNSTPTFENF